MARPSAHEIGLDGGAGVQAAGESGDDAEAAGLEGGDDAVVMGGVAGDQVGAEQEDADGALVGLGGDGGPGLAHQAEHASWGLTLPFPGGSGFQQEGEVFGDLAG